MHAFLCSCLVTVFACAASLRLGNPSDKHVGGHESRLRFLEKRKPFEHWSFEQYGGWGIDEEIPANYKDMLRKVIVENLGEVSPPTWWKEPADNELLCVAVVRQNVEPFDLISKMLSSCDAYVLFSNVSNPEFHVMKLWNGSMDAVIGGQFDSALNTPIMVAMWEWLAKHVNAPSWIAKVDPDLVLLPHRLKRALGQLNSSMAYAPGDGQGPLMILSSAALAEYGRRHRRCVQYEAFRFPQEDLYLPRCLQVGEPGMTNFIPWHDTGLVGESWTPSVDVDFPTMMHVCQHDTSDRMWGHPFKDRQVFSMLLEQCMDHDNLSVRGGPLTQK